LKKFFGFLPDLRLTTKENARQIVADMPCWYYFLRPTNLSSHDLTTRLQPPPNWRSLLGLGLNFCIRAKYTNFNLSKMEERFRDDLYTKAVYAALNNDDDEEFDRTLWIKSNRKAPKHKVPPGLPNRITDFFKAMKKEFKKRKCSSNLLPQQRHVMQTLKESTALVVFPTDKNLGPAITERRRYVKLAFTDHLNDRSTYQRLTKASAEGKTEKIAKMVTSWIRKNKDVLPKKEKTFLTRATRWKDDEDNILFPHFYITAKVHKTPLKTRPIISVSGSTLEALGKWTDRQLQSLGRNTKAYVSSSKHLLEKLKELPPLPPTALLFTCDARSMYTNIDTEHALNNLRNKLPIHVISALEIIMRNNVFQFSDTFWLQKDGTAMGTPPACMWATLYFASHEDNLSEEFQQFLLFYKRYIDDGFGIWNWTGTRACKAAWTAFQDKFQEFGNLRWDFVPLAQTSNFLDLTLSINHGRVESTLYEKALNLYLYLPPHSAHAPGVLKGLIAGMLLRIIRLTSEPSTRKAHVQRFFDRLVARGYLATRIKPIFDKCFRKLAAPPVSTPTQPAEKPNPVFLHLQYHPLDPPSSTIQKLFEKHILKSSSKNPYQPPLAQMKNCDGVATGINRMIVAYHRPPNLGNLLAPRRFDSRPGLSVSEHFTARRQPRGRHTHPPTTHTHTHTPPGDT
jgi:hypothetical protein